MKCENRVEKEDLGLCPSRDHLFYLLLCIIMKFSNKLQSALYRGTCARRTIEMWPSVRRGEEQYIFPLLFNVYGFQTFKIVIPILVSWRVISVNKVIVQCDGMGCIMRMEFCCLSRGWKRRIRSNILNPGRNFSTPL